MNISFYVEIIFLSLIQAKIFTAVISTSYTVVEFSLTLVRHIKSFVTSSQRIKIRGSTYQILSIYLPCCIVLYKCCPNVLKCPIKALKNLVKTSRKIQHKTIWYDVVPLVDNKKYPNYVRPYEIFGIYT